MSFHGDDLLPLSAIRVHVDRERWTGHLRIANWAADVYSGDYERLRPRGVRSAAEKARRYPIIPDVLGALPFHRGVIPVPELSGEAVGDC